MFKDLNNFWSRLEILIPITLKENVMGKEVKVAHGQLILKLA